MSSWYILDINLLLDVLLANIFSQSVRCLFILSVVSFTVQKKKRKKKRKKTLVWCTPICLFFPFVSLAWGDKCETKQNKTFLRAMPESLLPMFSSRCFTVWDLIFKSLIYFKFIPAYDVRKLSSFNFFFLLACVQFSKCRLLNRLSLPHCIFLPPFS